MQNREDFLRAFHDWISSFMDLSMHRMAAYARDNGLSMSQIGTLFRLHRSGACGVTDIGESIGVSPAAASQLIDRLVQAELLVRSEDPNDRRVRRVELSERGGEVIAELAGAREGIAGEIADALAAEDLANGASVLARLAREARRIKEEKPE